MDAHHAPLHGRIHRLRSTAADGAMFHVCAARGGFIRPTRSASKIRWAPAPLRKQMRPAQASCFRRGLLLRLGTVPNGRMVHRIQPPLGEVGVSRGVAKCG